jgi:SAM-dependent methyltransferase
VNDFRPHPIEWTREKAVRFWTYMSSRDVEPNYFSRAVGDDLIQFVQKQGLRLGGRVLDYGCGAGHLLAALLRAGVACEGADFDPSSLQRTRALVGNDRKFRGVTLLERLPTPFADGSFDYVFMIETIEHLLPEELGEALDELGRIVRSGGHVIVTTPNEEKLAKNEAMCPECGSIFHLVQHVSTWSASSLAAALARAGFEPVFCAAVTLRPPSRMNWLRVLRAKVADVAPPHLVYVGRRR